MKERAYKFFILDILNSTDKILKYTQDITFEEFLQDEKTIEAVERNFEIIGEAAKFIPDEIKEKFGNIPFNKIISLRNKIIHNYFGIDYELLWNIIKNRLPELKKEIEKIINLKQTKI